LNKNFKNKSRTAKKAHNDDSSYQSFSFGDPEPCLHNRMTDYLGVFADLDGIYSPPISLKGLVELLDVNAQHEPILRFKRNMILKWLKPNPLISRNNFSKASFDYLWSANAYFLKVYNIFGDIIQLRHLPAINMRYTTQRGVYAQLQSNGSKVYFEPDHVIHIKEYDPKQGIYGRVGYYGGIQSALLNEDATLFRRKYFKNGNHMGFIFSMADPNLRTEDETALQKAIASSKGVGNFKSLFLNNRKPNATADNAVKIIPVGDVSTKDEFERIKRITLNDMLSMHRASEALSGQSSGESPGFGDLDKITASYYNNEVVPLQQEMSQINDHLPKKDWITFIEPNYSDLLIAQSENR